MQFADQSLHADSELWLKAIRIDAKNNFSLAPPVIRTNREVALNAVKQWDNLLLLVDPLLLQDKEFIIEVVKQNGLALFWVPNFMTDKQVFLEAVKQNGLALQYASPLLKNDEEVVSAAIKQDGMALVYAHERFKKNRDFVLVTIKNIGLALENVDTDLKKDWEIALTAVKQNGLALDYVDESLKNDRNFIIKIIKFIDFECIYKYTDRSFCGDREIISIAVGCNPKALGFADGSLKNDKEFVKRMVAHYGMALEFAGDQLKKDPEVTSAAINNDPLAVIFADHPLDHLQTIQKVTEIVDQFMIRLLFKDPRHIIADYLVYPANLGVQRGKFDYRAIHAQIQSLRWLLPDDDKFFSKRVAEIGNLRNHLKISIKEDVVKDESDPHQKACSEFFKGT